jgi:hypothetical protein
MVLTDGVERILDLTMGLEVGPGGATSAAPVLRESGLDPALELELARHWLVTSRRGDTRRDRSAASALSIMGTVLEKMGELDEAQGHHDAALSLAEKAGNKYAQSRSHSGKGRIEMLRGSPVDAARQLQMALRVETGMKDGFAQARTLMSLGDVSASRGSLGFSVSALRYYHRARRAAQRLRYDAAIAAADARLSTQTARLAGSLQRAAGGFIEKRMRREAVSLSTFCQDFANQFVEVLAGHRKPALQASPARLGFGGSEVKTPAVLSAMVRAVEEVLSPEADRILSEGDGVDSQRLSDDMKRFVSRSGTRQRLVGLCREQGLSKGDAGNLVDYLAHIIVENPEQLVGGGIASPSGGHRTDS